MKHLMKQFMVEESGQGMVEYGLILALISVVAITVLTNIGTNMNSKFGLVNEALEETSASSQ